MQCKEKTKTLFLVFQVHKKEWRIEFYQCLGFTNTYYQGSLLFLIPVKCRFIYFMAHYCLRCNIKVRFLLRFFIFWLLFLICNLTLSLFNRLFRSFYESQFLTLVIDIMQLYSFNLFTLKIIFENQDTK